MVLVRIARLLIYSGSSTLRYPIIYSNRACRLYFVLGSAWQARRLDLAMNQHRKLFSPVQVGHMALSHRVVLAPLTRFRADTEHVHHGAAVKHYTQRAQTPGTLLISEGTLVAPEAGGYDNVPGIWTHTQIAAWKKVF